MRTTTPAGVMPRMRAFTVVGTFNAGMYEYVALEEFAALELPESYRAVTVHKDEVDMFEGLASRDKDPRKSLHLDEVPTPVLAPGEAMKVSTAVSTGRASSCGYSGYSIVMSPSATL